MHAHPGIGPWWRQPVAWLGVAVFAASLAGCILMMVLGARHQDPALPVHALEVLKVPLTRKAPDPHD